MALAPGLCSPSGADWIQAIAWQPVATAWHVQLARHTCRPAACLPLLLAGNVDAVMHCSASAAASWGIGVNEGLEPAGKLGRQGVTLVALTYPEPPPQKLARSKKAPWTGRCWTWLRRGRRSARQPPGEGGEPQLCTRDSFVHGRAATEMVFAAEEMDVELIACSMLGVMG